MDPVADALREGLVDHVVGDDPKLKSTAINCLKIQCQRSLAQCRADRGPCPQKAAHLEARRACRPLKKDIMEAMYPECLSIAEALRRPSSGDFESMINQCVHKNAENTREYRDCYMGHIGRTLITCATDKCIEETRRCMTNTCGLSLPDK